VAFRTLDFRKETSTTTGTGNVTLLGARTPGSPLSSGIGVGDTFEYGISHQTLNEWETGIGTMLTATTFSRSVLTSSNANALVPFSFGTKSVDVVMTATRLQTLAGPLFFNGVSASSGSLSFDNAGGVSFGIAGNVVTAAAPSAAGFSQITLQSAINFANLSDMTQSSLGSNAVSLQLLGTASTSIASFGNVHWRLQGNRLAAVAIHRVGGGASLLDVIGQSFSNANGVSWGLGTTDFNGRFANITASFEPRIGLVSHVGGNSVSNVTRLAFSDASNVTWSLSTAAGAATVFASVAPGGGGGLLSVSANNGTYAAAGLSFSTNGRVQFSTTAGSQVVAVALLAISAGTQFAFQQNLGFLDSNGVSFGGNASAITASFSTLNFSNANNVSFGLAGSTLTASASFPAATSLVFSNSNGVSFGIAGSTLTANFSSLVFSNSNNVTFGLAGSTVTASASFPAATSLSFSNLNGVTFGIAGSTLTASVNPGGGGFTFSGFDPIPGGVIVENQYGQNSLAVHPVTFPNVQFDRFAMPVKVGGGSSEITVCERGKIVLSKSTERGAAP